MNGDSGARTQGEWSWEKIKDHPVTYLRQRLPGIAFWPLISVAFVIGAIIFYSLALLRLLFTPPASFRDWWDSI